MKKTLGILTLISLITACGVRKESEKGKKHVLFSEFNEEVAGDITITVLNETQLNCDSNIVTVKISSILPENTIVSITDGIWSRENQPESHYLLIIDCNRHPNLSIGYKQDYGKRTTIKQIDLMQFISKEE